MKWLRLIIFILVNIGSVVRSQTILWQQETSVSDGSIFGNIRPRIVLSNNDIPVVINGKAGGKIYSSRWNGTSFDTPISILPEGVSAYITSWTGPSVASRGDTIFIVFKALPLETGHIYIVKSYNGGISYSDTIRADNHNQGVAWLPSIECDETGNPTVIYMAHDSLWLHPRYMINHSTDLGNTFVGEIDVAGSIPDEACDCCPAEYVIEGNNHALLYRNNENNIRDIFAVYSSDDGLTFSSYSNLDNLNWNVNFCPSTGPHGIFSSEKLISVFASKASGNYKVYVSNTDLSIGLGNSNLSSMIPPANNAGSQNYPRISGNGDTIVVVWQEAETSNYDIMCSWTTNYNNESITTNKEIVNTLTSGTQTNPDIVFKNNTIHIVFQDTPSGDVIYKNGTFNTLNSLELNDQLAKIKPNPSFDGKFYIELPENTNLDIFDLFGKKISTVQSNYSGGKIVDLGTNYGCYFVVIRQGEKVLRTKIINAH